jgi:hypothetical protein
MRNIDIEYEYGLINPYLNKNILSTERNAHGLSQFTLKKYAISPEKDCIYYIRITRNFMFLFQEYKKLEKLKRQKH